MRVIARFGSIDLALLSEDEKSRLVEDAEVREVLVIIGADANSHNTMWGSSGTNESSDCFYY